MDVKLPSLGQESQWEKIIDRSTHRLPLVRCEVVSGLLVGWRVLVFPTGWPLVAWYFPGSVAFGLRAHPKLGERAGAEGLVRVSQERRKAGWASLLAFTVQGENQNPTAKPATVEKASSFPCPCSAPETFVTWQRFLSDHGRTSWW